MTVAFGTRIFVLSVNSVDPYQTPLNEVSDQGLQSVTLIHELHENQRYIKHPF